jgi:sensor c-di-GMP phosphodiesterase-like protein
MFFPEGDIHRAFEEEEFFPCFQPLVELRTNQLAGFEVLARWNHWKLGSIPPAVFIPVVEKSGLINRLTKTMLDKAFEVGPLLPPFCDAGRKSLAHPTPRCNFAFQA